MPPQQSLSVRKESMRSFLPVDQDSSTGAFFSSHEPWHQNALADSTTAGFQFEHSSGNVLAPHGMEFSAFNDMGSALSTGIQRANPAIPEEPDGFHLQDGFFDATLQYGLPKMSPSINGEMLLSESWSYDMNAGAVRPAADLSSIPEYESGPVAGTFDRYEAVLPAFESCAMPREQTVSTSPSQYSSAAGSLSCDAAMSLSRRSSIAYASHSAVSNTIEQTQAQGEVRPNSIVAAASKFPSQQVEAMTPRMGSRQSANASKDHTGKGRAGSDESSDACAYPTPPSSKPAFFMASTAGDHQPYSLSPVPSQVEPDVSQAAPMPQGSQRQRNRRAAIKCREKTKAAMAQLEATERAVSLEHMELSTIVADLRGEVLALKNQLLLHGNCNCDSIQQYLKNAARSIGEGSATNHASSQSRVAAAWTNSPGLGRHQSFS